MPKGKLTLNVGNKKEEFNIFCALTSPYFNESYVQIDEIDTTSAIVVEKGCFKDPVDLMIC